MAEGKKISKGTETFYKVLAISTYMLFIIATLNGINFIFYEYLQLEDEIVFLSLGVIMIVCAAEWIWMSKYTGKIKWFNAFPYISLVTIVSGLLAFMFTSIYAMLCAISLLVILGFVLYSRIVDFKNILGEQKKEQEKN